jgi:hypothetical protein
MDAAELRARARHEADELGPEPAGPEPAVSCSCRAGRRRRRAAPPGRERGRDEWTDREAARLLLDAATLAEIGA